MYVLCISAAMFVAVRFGRKRTMLGFFAVKIVGILMAVFAQNYTIFVIGRFLIGGGQVGYFLPGFVLGNVQRPLFRLLILTMLLLVMHIL